VQRPEEKKLLLGALGNLQAVGALELITPYLEDAAVKEEASAAVVALAERLLKGGGATRNAPKLVAPLEKAAQATANPSLAQRAKTLLQQARNK
jgi:hypothetical protein